MEDNSLKGDENLLAITGEDRFLKEQKAVFYSVLAKPDSMTRLYNRNVVIEIEDIYSLNERINEKLRSYQDAGYLINVTIRYANGKLINFSNWTSFDEYKWTENEPISSIVITWEFNAVLPYINNPQRHTLMVKMSNRLRPEEMLHLVLTGKIEEIGDIDNDFFPVVARVDFVDRMFGNELLNLVEEWDKGLKDFPVHHPKFMLFLKKHKAKCSTSLNIISCIFVALCIMIIMGNVIYSMDFDIISKMTATQLVHVIYIIFGGVITWLVLRKLIGIVTDSIFDRLRNYGDNIVFNITKGDKDRQNKLKTREQKNRIKIIGNILLTIILDIVCGVLVNLFS